MSKRLVLVFCALLAFAFAVPAFAAVQNIKVSGDILTRGIIRNDFDLTKDEAGSSDDISVFNTVTRLRVDADLTDNVSTTVRIGNERNWDQLDWDTADLNIDLAYVALKEFLCSPLTLTIGRQELHFGNDMIMGDGVGYPWWWNPNQVNGTNQTTNYDGTPGLYGLNGAPVNGDLSLRKSFDAIRGTLNYDPLVIDVVYSMLRENVITGDSPNDDAYLWGINGNYKFSDKWNTTAEAYVWSKINDGTQDGPAKGKAETTYTYGVRASTSPSQKVNIQQEFAFQLGDAVVNDNGADARERSAWASQTMGYITPGWKYDPMFGLIYSYFSGDANPTNTDADKKYHAWDPMFENQTSGSIINALFPQTDCHNIDFMMKLVPFEDVTMRADYVLQFLAKKLTSNAIVAFNDYSHSGDGDYGLELAGDENFLGQELDINTTFDYTEDVQFGLLTGWFWSGKAVAETKDSNGGPYKQRVMAAEMIASCNVKF